MEQSLEKQNLAEKITKKIDSYLEHIHSFIKLYEKFSEMEEFHKCCVKYEVSNNDNVNPQIIAQELANLLIKFKETCLDEARIPHLAPHYLLLLDNILTPIKGYLGITYLFPELKVFLEKEVQEDTHLFKELKDYIANLSESTNKLKEISAFDLIRTIEKNVVMIGANGAGKSSFSRATKKILGSNIAIIPAQKILYLEEINSIPVGENPLQKLHKSQQEDKVAININYSEFRSIAAEFTESIAILISLHMKHTQKVYEDKASTRTSPLEDVIAIWNSLISHRTLKYDLDSSKLIVTTPEKDKYSPALLSDGEKTILYYIANVILAKKDSYIIVDEPENNLNLNITLSLWDILEQTRKDCIFIYLTHDLSFATSRINVQKIWIKKFISSTKWEMELIEEEEDLPEELLLALLGSRKPILFCEGEKNSIDYKLYSLLFSDYSIFPVGGHLDVYNSTRAFNSTKINHGNKAIGIIDGDTHRPKRIKKWKEYDVYCLKCNEVENILCDEKLLVKSEERFCWAKGSVKEAKKRLLKKLEEDLDTQVTLYIKYVVNEVLQENLITKVQNIEEIKTQVAGILGKIQIEELKKERESLLKNIIEKKDFQEALNHYCNKGLFSILLQGKYPDYKNQVLRYLAEDKELQKYLREMYFSETPLVNELDQCELK